MSIFEPILRDLRERRLWPVALVMVVALVAVPVLLSKSGQAAQTPAPTPPSPTASAATALPAISVTGAPAHSNLNGNARDPFKQQKLKAAAAAKTTTTTSTTSNTAAKTPTNGTSTTSTTTTATGGGSTTGTGTGTTPAVIPTGKTKPAPTGLTDTQSYRVTLAMTNSAGGIDTSDPLQRLSVLPNAQEPLLVELGVLKGGNRVLFAVQPQAAVSGPGVCTPGPVDCEILSLAPGRIEQLSTQSVAGLVPLAKFAVTSIKADQHSSAGAADKSRRDESAAGRRLLNQSKLGALRLFPYKPSLGALVDLRNLKVGGN
jgi:hypothetical protein